MNTPGREFFMPQALEVAPHLLGARLSVDSPEGLVEIRITEVEAYHGVGTTGPYDPGSHARSKKTERNASMFGPPGHAYVYFNYGMHYALNLVCAPDGIASGVLLRAAEVVAGEEVARSRRERKRGSSASNSGSSKLHHIPHQQLARGPGNLAAALGLTRETHDGSDLFCAPFRFTRPAGLTTEISSGPRVGVSGVAGGPAYPWRFWIAGDPSVSQYRPGKDVPFG